MPSSDEQAIEQNKRNSVLDLQLTGIPIKLHERPDPSDSRPGSRSDYLTRPMSAIPMYFKERGRGSSMKERPKSAGNPSLRRKSNTNQFGGVRSRINLVTNINKGRSSRSEMSLNISGGRGSGRLEPGLAAKPPLPPARPAHTQSLDDIVNIKFLRWFPESSPDREKEVEEDEAVGRCDSSLANDDISDLASSDSRLGFTSPDIALNSEGNLRPGPLLSHRELSLHDTGTPLNSPHPNTREINSQTYVSPYNCKNLNPNMAFEKDLPSGKDTPDTLVSQQKDLESSVELTPQVPLYDKLKKMRSASLELDDRKSPSPVFSKRERNHSSSNSASTSGSGTVKRLDKNSRSISLESEDTMCNTVVINNSRFNESSEKPAESSLSKVNNFERNSECINEVASSRDAEVHSDHHKRGRNLRFSSARMFDKHENFYENSRQLLSTPESGDTPEPILHNQKFPNRTTKFTYRLCRNTTPDSLTTPEPSPTPEPMPSTSHRSYHRDDKRTKKVTIDLCTDSKRRTNEKASQDSGLSIRDFDNILDFDCLSVGHPHGDGKDKVSEDSGVRSLMVSTDSKVVAADSQPVSKHEEILTWMGHSVQEAGDGADVTSTYDDLVNMIKVIENDEVESIKLEVLSTCRSTNNSACSNMAPSGHATSDILGLLEGVEEASRGTTQSIRPQAPSDSDSQRSLALAQRCMTLSDRLEAEKQRCSSTEEELRAAKESLIKVKSDSEAAVARHQTFINQLLKEKLVLGEQCAALVKEVEAKHRKALKTLDERHSVELKKQEEKLLAAEKLRREKWVDAKTKKIKEMTVAGLESELTRMSTAHQDELKELRRHHDEEVSRTESVWSRRLSQAREEAAREREAAVTQEREAARSRLQDEVNRLEVDQRDARRNLLQDVREERQRMEIQMERTLNDRSSMLDSKYQQALSKLDEKLADINKQHEEEMNRLREGLEAERESWLAHQTQALAEKEREVRSEAKRERDRHIEAAIRKLDQESVEKQQQLESKLVRLKESWDEERSELENETRDLKRKLKEVRKELEESRNETETIINKSKQDSEVVANELEQTKSRLATLISERSDEGSLTASRVAELEQQLAQARHLHQEALSDRQAQLDLLYTRVKDAVAKKDEQIRILQKERDNALEQCRQLENIMERRTAVD